MPDKNPEYYSLETKITDVVVTKGKNKGKVKKGKIYTPVKNFGKVYELASNLVQTRNERASAIINSLAVLRGGAKQAAFETDVSPKVLIMAGLTCGNPIFNTLFEDDNSGNTRGKTVSIDVDALKEIVRDYKDKICTPVYIGIRTGFLKNEDEVRRELTRDDGFIVTTPIDAAKQLTESLPVGPS
jgi:CRISPR-associated protein Cst2